MNRSVHIVLLATVLLGSFLRVLGSEVVRPVLRGGGMTAVGVRREPARKLNLNSLSAPHSHVMIDSSRAIHGYDDMNVEEEEEVDEDEEDAEQERMLSIFYSASYYGHAAEIKTEAPSRAPTPKPSSEPTQMPSAESFAEPVVERTPQATPKPSNPEPTPHPSEESTPEPTPEPSEAPTPELTPEPSKAPTSKPSRAPSSNPTSYPSARPTVQPSVKPTRRPTLSPTTVPTAPAPFFGIDMEFVSSELKVIMDSMFLSLLALVVLSVIVTYVMVTTLNCLSDTVAWVRRTCCCCLPQSEDPRHRGIDMSSRAPTAVFGRPHMNPGAQRVDEKWSAPKSRLTYGGYGVLGDEEDSTHSLSSSSHPLQGHNTAQRGPAYDDTH